MLNPHGAKQHINALPVWLILVRLFYASASHSPWQRDMACRSDCAGPASTHWTRRVRAMACAGLTPDNYERPRAARLPGGCASPYGML
jgi:hypothetical protein